MVKSSFAHRERAVHRHRLFHPVKMLQLNSLCTPVTLLGCTQSWSYITGTQSFRLSIWLASVFNNISPNFTRSFARFENTRLATLWSSSSTRRARRRASTNPTYRYWNLFPLVRTYITSPFFPFFVSSLLNFRFFILRSKQLNFNLDFFNILSNVIIPTSRSQKSM